jgi:hypothetical protein
MTLEIIISKNKKKVEILTTSRLKLLALANISGMSLIEVDHLHKALTKAMISFLSRLILDFVFSSKISLRAVPRAFI